jgi:cytochrome c-type biogenesis protein CcmH
MMLWVVLAAMTAIVVALLLHPLMRKPAAPPRRAEYDLTVYRDQLAEVARDLERGVIEPAQADAARLEIERRMLAADAAGPGPATGRPLPRKGAARMLAIALVVAVPAGAVALYLHLGAPDVPSMPFAAGTPAPTDPAAADLAALADELARKLAVNPALPQGWVLLARMYTDLGRYGEAANAYVQALATGAEGPEVQAAYGEALVAAAEGQVTQRAAQAFTAALAVDPGHPQARFYIALAHAQAGEWDLALAQWLALEKDSPAQAAWRPLLARYIEEAARELGLDPAALPGR